MYTVLQSKSGWAGLPKGPRPAFAANMRIALFHATANAIAPMLEAFAARAPDAVITQYMDEGLLPLARKEGLSSRVRQRLADWLDLAVGDGAQATLLTCSTFTPLVPELRSQRKRPIVAIDEAMLDEALALGSSFAVLATFPSAAATTESLLAKFAERQNRSIDVSPVLVEDAFACLERGERERHDELVLAALANLPANIDGLLFAQASMARAAPSQTPAGVPVLTSPASAIRRVVDRILQQQPSSASAS